MSITSVRGNNPNTTANVLASNPGDKVATDKNELAPVVAILSKQIPLPQAQNLAGQVAMVKVLKTGPGNLADLEYQGQMLNVKLPPGRPLNAGEMIAVAFALNDRNAGLGVQSTQSKSSTQETTSLQKNQVSDLNDDETESGSSIINRLSTGAKLIGLIERLTGNVQNPIVGSSKNIDAIMKQMDESGNSDSPNQTNDAQTTQAKPSNNPNTLQNLPNKTVAAQSNQATQATNAVVSPNHLSQELAKQVSSAVEHSGLFYESHLQQWVNGQRSVDELAQEPQAKFLPDDIIGENGFLNQATQTSAKMAHAQLAVLDQTKIQLQIQGLMNQPIDVEIHPDEHSEGAQQNSEETAKPWVARLKLDMAHLGVIEARVRMVGSQCDVTLSGLPSSKAIIDEHWQDFEQAMKNNGLNLAHGQFIVN